MFIAKIGGCWGALLDLLLLSGQRPIMSTILLLVLILSVVSTLANLQGPGDYFTYFEEAMAVARTNAGVRGMMDAKIASDLLGRTSEDTQSSSATPPGFGGKEIEIVCPGVPTVNIRDIYREFDASELDSETATYKGDCVVVKMKGVNFAFEMSMNCEDGEDKMAFTQP
jgi:hypothetical protein